MINKKEGNTMINIDVKSQLAKLIASENLTVQHNAVKTASFDTLNRVLTLPIFKFSSGHVYDMLIAHECAHALHTPYDNGWKEVMKDDELRSYCNVLEDCRIDKLIQKQYPGVVKDYIKGFDMLLEKDFFGLSKFDINDGQLIDKINIYYKSSKRHDIEFSKDEEKILSKVDNLKTFDDVVKLAKELLNWQKKENEENKIEMPKIDELISSNKSGDEQNNQDSKDDTSGNSSQEEDNSGDEEKMASSNSDTKDGDELKSDDKGETSVQKGPQGGGSLGLKSITDTIYQEMTGHLVDKSQKNVYTYYSIPKFKSYKDVLTTCKEFNTEMNKWFYGHTKNDHGNKKYITWLNTAYKKFQNDSKKTVQYLVKEFQMKKSATAYKRATQDKTGVIDPLKLKNYKFSDDIFKRLTVLPNSKNHGMVLLLDWSGSMHNCLQQTVEQLLNLVYFCKAIQIPFEVYAFTSETKEGYDYQDFNSNISYKHGDVVLRNIHLINMISHRQSKKDFETNCKYVYHMAQYYNNRMFSHSYEDYDSGRFNNFGIPNQYTLGSTPLNEALVIVDSLLDVFKKKYKVEKMSMITLTDGAANGVDGVAYNTDKGMMLNRGAWNPILKLKNKIYRSNCKLGYSGQDMTGQLLSYMKDRHNLTNIGFYVLRRLRGYDGERFLWGLETDKKEKLKLNFSKQAYFTTNIAGYDEYFVLNVKKMDVENFDMSNVKSSQTKDIRNAFKKSMKNRIVSRVLLTKFIEKVA